MSIWSTFFRALQSGLRASRAHRDSRDLYRLANAPGRSSDRREEHPPDMTVAPRFYENLPRFADLGGSTHHGLGPYFHQDLWAASKVHLARAPEHVDVGSRIDGLVAHVAAFTEVVCVGLRPLDADGHHIKARVGSVLCLPFDDRSVQSLSHLPTGEYVDCEQHRASGDPEGLRLSLAELQRVVGVGGNLYLGVPLGHHRENSDRRMAMSVEMVIGALHELTLVEFSGVNEAGELVRDAGRDEFEHGEHFYGLFHFTRR